MKLDLLPTLLAGCGLIEKFIVGHDLQVICHFRAYALFRACIGAYSLLVNFDNSEKYGL